MTQFAHSTLTSESLAIRKAIFEMGGGPLRFAFEILGVPWPWCWFALEVRRDEIAGLADMVLPTQPGDFDILIGKLRHDGSPDFGWVAAVEAKRLVVRPNDEMRGSSYGTTQAGHLKDFGFDRALLLHLIVRELRENGALSPFPRDNRDGFTVSLQRRMRRLHRSCGWLPLLWTHVENAQGGMTGGSGYDPRFPVPPNALRPRSVLSWLRPSTRRAEAAHKHITVWLEPSHAT